MRATIHSSITPDSLIDLVNLRTSSYLKLTYVRGKNFSVDTVTSLSSIPPLASLSGGPTVARYLDSILFLCDLFQPPVLYCLRSPDTTGLVVCTALPSRLLRPGQNLHRLTSRARSQTICVGAVSRSLVNNLRTHIVSMADIRSPCPWMRGRCDCSVGGERRVRSSVEMGLFVREDRVGSGVRCLDFPLCLFRGWMRGWAP